MKVKIQNTKEVKLTRAVLLELLQEALWCINQELISAGEDEVAQHPILQQHDEVAHRIEKILDQAKRKGLL